ncbi:MAG: ankyrin repeat domain-containing protein [Mycobacteriales bacterium]
MTQELFDAIAAGNAERVGRLVAADPAVVRHRNAEGIAPIVWAAYVGKPDIGSVLAAAVGQLDLAEAAVLGRTDDVRRLLDSGTPVDEMTPDGFTALHYAAFFGHPDLARLLIERGATIDVAARNDMHVMPLHSAAAGAHHEVAVLLIDAGADVNAAQRHGWTPLHSAAEHGDEALAKALLAHGANPAARAEDGTTPVELASSGGHTELGKLLA